MRRYRYEPLALPAIKLDTNGEFCRWSDVAPLLRAAREALRPDHTGQELKEACRKLDQALGAAS